MTLQKASHTAKDISKRPNVLVDSVYKVLRCVKEQGSVETLSRSGRSQSVVTLQNVSKFRKKVVRNRGRSIFQVFRELKISRSSTSRIAARAGIKSKPPLKCQLITTKQKQKRVQQCRKLLKILEENPEKVIFWTDETKVTVDTFVNRQTTRVLMANNTPECIVMCSKKPFKDNAWGLVASDGNKMPLIFFPDGENMNTATYVKHALTPMFKWIKDMKYEPGTFVFQELWLIILR